MSQKENIFQPAATPRSGLTLWYWLLFDYVLLQRFENNSDKSSQRRWFLKAYAWLLLLYVFILVARFFIVIWVVENNLPAFYPDLFYPPVLEFWQTSASFSEKIYFYFS